MTSATRSTRRAPATSAAGERFDRLDWTAAAGELDELGCTIAGDVLEPSQCHEVADLYDDDARFRSTIDMARFRFGQGQYRYFDRPLPGLVAELRAAFVVVEQRPRAQSRATSSQIGQGQALIFTTRDRPVSSSRGWSAAPMRHGVSVVRSGRRRTLGLVFHDAACRPAISDCPVPDADCGPVEMST